MKDDGIIARFFLDKYIQKSKNFLYPILGIDTPCLNTYMYWESLDDSIDEYKLIVEYPKTVTIEHELILGVYETLDSMIYIFDIDTYAKDVDRFREGKYSEFSSKLKDRILKYYKWVIGGRIMYVSEAKETGSPCHYHVFLYPRMFVREVAEEWSTVFNYYTTYEEAMAAAMECTEFCAPPNIDKETLKKDMI